MKSLVWTLLLVICTHVLVLDAVHHEHDAADGYAQTEQAEPAHLDVLDQGSEHCCQCHGFMAGMDCAPARQPAPSSTGLTFLSRLPDTPPESLYRPPIA